MPVRTGTELFCFFTHIHLILCIVILGQDIPFLLKKYLDAMSNDQMNPESSQKYHRLLLDFVDALPEQKKLDLLYSQIKEDTSGDIALKLSDTIKELNLFDFNRCIDLLRNENFQIQKRAVRIVTYDKPFYNRQDINDLQTIRELMQSVFVERGKRAMKKQLLSSKEKEVYTCECGKTNDLEAYCSGCGQDIYGFKQNEMKASAADAFIDQKIALIAEYVA